MHQLARTKAEEEERIAAVLQQRMHDAERTTKELQQLRNESAELRDLQASRHHKHTFNHCAIQHHRCFPDYMVAAGLVLHDKRGHS